MPSATFTSTLFFLKKEESRLYILSQNSPTPNRNTTNQQHKQTSHKHQNKHPNISPKHVLPLYNTSNNKLQQRF